MKPRREIAAELFLQGYTCAQAVLLAFSDLTGLEKQTALRISSSFGGGMGRLREVCGAVSGMFMTAGLLYGYEEPNQPKKTEHYRRIQQLAASFREKNGSIVCRDLLGARLADTTPIPQERTEAYYASRPCVRMVADAAEILENYITAYPPSDRGTRNEQTKGE